MKAAFIVLVAVLGASIGSQVRAAEHRVVTDGLVVNFGITSAEDAMRTDGGHRNLHPDHPPGGSQHLLVTLDDAKSGKRIADAEVDVAVMDPKGHVEKKRMLRTQGGGLPDYSELFVFPWSGTYSVHIVVTRAPGARPVRARFTVDHRV